jgi:hypothetical protein
LGQEKVIPGNAQNFDWPAFLQAVTVAGKNLEMRMIDNMPAFPDETPEPAWKEVRVTLGNGMLTLRRSTAELSVIVWGNADLALLDDQTLLETIIRNSIKSS